MCFSFLWKILLWTLKFHTTSGTILFLPRRHCYMEQSVEQNQRICMCSADNNIMWKFTRNPWHFTCVCGKPPYSRWHNCTASNTNISQQRAYDGLQDPGILAYSPCGTAYKLFSGQLRSPASAWYSPRQVHDTEHNSFLLQWSKKTNITTALEGGGFEETDTA